MKRLTAAVFGAIALVSGLVSPAFAAAPEVPLIDPVLEARAQSLAREIRCVVCENEPIALSSADIAVDMRAAIRARLTAGDSDAQIRRFFAERYGEFVLLRPRVGLDTLALWGAPLALLILGGGSLFLISRRKDKTANVALLGQFEEPGQFEEDAAARAALADLERERI